MGAWETGRSVREREGGPRVCQMIMVVKRLRIRSDVCSLPAFWIESCWPLWGWYRVRLFLINNQTK